MSARSSIIKALEEKLKAIDGTGSYLTNLSGNVYTKLKFWDEINDFPSVYIVAGSESREYLPGGFKWGFLNVSLKVYVKNETPIQSLEELLQDIETVLDGSTQLQYSTNKETTDILISSIVTDEGLLAPYGVGEVTIVIRYQIL